MSCEIISGRLLTPVQNTYSEVELPGPRSTVDVDPRLSDRELFVKQLREGWEKELDDVPWCWFVGSGTLLLGLACECGDDAML